MNACGHIQHYEFNRSYIDNGISRIEVRCGKCGRTFNFPTYAKDREAEDLKTEVAA